MAVKRGKSKVFVICSICMLLFSCNNSKDGVEKPEVPINDGEIEDEDSANSLIKEEYEAILSLITSTITNSQHCLVDQNTPAECNATISYTPEKAGLVPEGPRVLIIDKGMKVPALSKLSNNLVAYYEANPQGEIIEPYKVDAPTEVLLPSVVDTVLNSELLKNTVIPPAAFVSASFSEIEGAEQFNAQLQNVININNLSDPTENHGIGMINKLRDLVPNVELVVLSVNGLELSLQANEFCNVSSETYVETIENYYRTLEHDIIERIEHLQIDYLSVSSYATSNGYLRKWSQICPDSNINEEDANWLASRREQMFQNIASNTQAILVQSIADPINGNVSNETHTTCTNRASNHLLVSYAHTPANADNLLNISPDGENASESLLGKTYPLEACNTHFYSLDALYIEKNIPGVGTFSVPVETNVSFDYLGMGRALQVGTSGWPVSSSFVPPIAIAHLIYLDSKLSSVESGIESIDNKPVRAPQLYEQLPVCQINSIFCHAIPEISQLE